MNRPYAPEQIHARTDPAHPRHCRHPVVHLAVAAPVVLARRAAPVCLLRHFGAGGDQPEWLLRQMGKPDAGSFEATTRLVERGAYRFIRHPMYASLLLLAWGICFKVGAIRESPLQINLGLAALATLCLYLTARVEEGENLARFGEPYRAYMRRTRRFIPFIW